MRERDIEKHLVKRAEELGGEVRKVQWIGRDKAPDRVLMLPAHVVDADGKPVRGFAGFAVRTRPARTLWVEVKRPGLKATFPADEHERAQDREHERMRAVGQVVVVIDSIEGVEELLR
jgi:hypothetical protein